MDDWTETRVGRAFHRLVVGPISHEDYRRMIRETYPAQLPPMDSGWARRWGAEVQDPVYAAHVDEARRRAETPSDGANRMAKTVEGALRRGRGVCSGWADEEDYGPRYT